MATANTTDDDIKLQDFKVDNSSSTANASERSETLKQRKSNQEKPSTTVEELDFKSNTRRSD